MDIKDLIRGTVRTTFKKNGYSHHDKSAMPQGKQQIIRPTIKEGIKAVGRLLKEALVVVPQSFQLKTERLSEATKTAHEQLYKNYVEAFNRVSAELDTANTHEANANKSGYRSLKTDETYNLNAIKLHELYFYNIADQASEISVDAIPYIRLSRDFGTFEKWQFDFMAACRSARNGWAVLVYEPYKSVYMNVVIDLHSNNVPFGCIPILVMDMWEHAYYADYQNNKDDYVASMMREINWNVVEARMALAEKSELNALYLIKPLYNNAPADILQNAGVNNAPISNISSQTGAEVPPTTPPAPAEGTIENE